MRDETVVARNPISYFSQVIHQRDLYFKSTFSGTTECETTNLGEWEKGVLVFFFLAYICSGLLPAYIVSAAEARAAGGGGPPGVRLVRTDRPELLVE